MKKIFSAIIIIAMTCSLSAPAFAVEQNVSGGAVIATGNSIYWSTAGGTATAATGVNLAAAPGGGVAPAGVSAFADGQSGTNISFAGNSTVAGSLGDLTGGSLTLVTLAGSGSTVSLGANTNSYVTTTNFSNTANASTTLSLASGANLTGNITNTTSNTGTLSLADGGHTINGNIGSTGVGLNQVNVGIGTSAINGNVTATNFAFTGNGGNLSIGAGDSITTANPITVAVDSATTITYLGTTTIGSDLGSLAGNKFAFVNFNGGTVTLGANIYTSTASWTNAATTVNGAILNLTGPRTIGGNLILESGSITGAGETLTLNGGGSYTMQSGSVSAILGGAVALNKTTAGTVILSGANTYSGATTVSGGGTLQISATNGLGNTSGTTISGGSTLESTNNSYSLATSITLGAGGGTIKTDGGSNTLTLNGGVATSGNTLTVTGAGTTAINTIGISGGGGLTMSGSQNLFLGATNNYSGATVVNSGTITLGAGATLGNGTTSGVTLNNADLGGLNLNGNNITVGYLNGAAGSTINSTGAGGTLTTGANNDATDTMAGAIEGAGGFTKVGTGTQVLSGANTYSGTTTISGTGTIQIGNGGTTGSLGTGAVTDNANLVFDRTDTPTVSNVISGTGTLTQEGVGGTLTLSGANSYSGGTTINANTTLLVGNAAALGTGAGVVANSGTLGIGTTNLILGNAYQQIAGSTLSLTANSPSSFGYITSNAGVSSVVAGSTVSVTVGGYIPNNANLTIIAGAGMAGAAPATVKTIGNSFVTFTDAISGNNLVLTAVRSGANSFAGQATDANGAAVGGVLDNITNPSSDMYNVLTALGNATPAQIASSEKSMSPTNDGSIIQSAEAMLNGFTSGMSAHLESMRTQGDTTGIATGDNCLEGAGIWAQGLGDYADQTERGLSNGYTATSYGVTAGADILTCNDSIRVGIGSGFGQTFINSRDFSGNTDINSIPASIYGEYRDSNYPFYIDAAFTFIYNMYNGSRQVTAGPTITRTADAEYDGEQYSGYLEGGYSFFYKTLRLTPLVSFQYMHLHTSSYTETDAGALDLNVGSQDYDMAQTGLGAKLGYPVDTKYGTLLPDLHFKWLYDWIGDNQATTASFTGGGTSFGTNGFAPAQSGFDFGAKLDFKTKYNVTVGLDYDFLFKDDYYEQYGTVTARYTF